MELEVLGNSSEPSSYILRDTTYVMNAIFLVIVDDRDDDDDLARASLA